MSPENPMHTTLNRNSEFMIESVYSTSFTGSNDRPNYPSSPQNIASLFIPNSGTNPPYSLHDETPWDIESSRGESIQNGDTHDCTTHDETSPTQFGTTLHNCTTARRNLSDQPGEHRSKHKNDDTETNSCQTVIRTPAALAALVADLVTHHGDVALDTETTGLDPDQDRVRLIQLAFRNRIVIIDLFAFPDPTSALAPLFHHLQRLEVHGHHLAFDLRFLAKIGFVPGTVFDTMLASQVLDAGQHAENGAPLSDALIAVLLRHLGITLDKSQQRSDWSRPILIPEQIEYAAREVQHQLALSRTLVMKLVAANLLDTTYHEMQAMKCIVWSQPVAIDAPAWIALASQAECEQQRLAEDMDRIAPHPGTLTGSRNWNAPHEVQDALGLLGITVPNTADETLARVDHELARLLREYRAQAKRSGTYGRKWLTQFVRNGVVLPRWNQLGANSGRMSCADPNLQQIPRATEYRRCFVARPGHILVKADYSQIELRIAAIIAQDPAMIAAYRSGQDLHKLTASRLTNKPEAQLTKDDRQLAKAVNFGLLYGMGARTLRSYALMNYGVVLNEVEAKRYRSGFFQLYSGVQAWHDRVEGQVTRSFRVNPKQMMEARTLGQRRRILPVAKRRSTGEAYPNVTEALNSPVQGTGADGLKRAMGLLWDRREECPGAVPLLFCHDEIVVECLESAAEHAKAWLEKAMVDAMEKMLAPVPVVVEVCVGKTWAG